VTKRAQLSDGTVLEFPDETTDQVMDQVVRSHMARARQEQEARTRSGDPMQPGSVIGSMAGQAAARAPGPRPRGTQGSWQEEVGGALANINRGIPFAQDLVNLAGGARTAASGGDFQEGIRAQRSESNALQQDFRNRRPNVAALSEGVGNATGVIPIGRSAQAVQLSGRGLPLLLRQSRNAAVAGAGAGYLFGAGTGDAPNQNPNERIDSANEAASFGSFFGAATPAAVNTLGAGYRAAEQPIRRLIDSLPRLAPRAEQGAGAFGAQLFGGGNRPPLRAVPPAPPPQGPRIPPAAMGTIDRLANRNRMTPDQVESAFAEAQRNPQGQVVADVFGDAGTRTTRAIAQGPGQSGGRAAETLRARAAEQPDRILNELNRRMAVAETPEQAMAALSRQYNEASANLYEPLFQRQMAPEMRATINEFLGRYADDPIMADAAARAQRIFQRDAAEGLASGSIEANYARYLHYMKMGLDDAARAAPQGGIQATELRGINNMRRRFVTALDNAIPGYREARNQWSTIANAEEALGEGRTLITQNSRAISARMAEMTDFERYHARVGFANEIANRIGLRGSVNGNRNVAEALGSPEMQRRVAAMFDSPEEAAAFLDTLNQQNTLMRNAAQWGSGSQTFSNAAHGADEALNTMVDMGVQAGTGNIGGAARRGVQGAANFFTGGALERANNQRGEVLLRRIDSDDAREFTNAVVAELRRREATRQAASSVSQTGAAASGSQQGRERR